MCLRHDIGIYRFNFIFSLFPLTSQRLIHRIYNTLIPKKATVGRVPSSFGHAPISRWPKPQSTYSTTTNRNYLLSGTMMMYSSTLSVLLSIGALSAASASESTATSTNGGLCYASCAVDESGIELCKFTTKVNLYAGELGYYQFEECGDDVNPTLGMEVGKTYQFVQKDRSN